MAQDIDPPNENTDGGTPGTPGYFPPTGANTKIAILVQKPAYTITEDQIVAAGGPWTGFVVRVTPINDNGSGPAAEQVGGASAATLSPGPLTEVAVGGGAGAASVTWRNSIRANYGYARLYRSSSFATAPYTRTTGTTVMVNAIAPPSGSPVSETITSPGGNYKVAVRPKGFATRWTVLLKMASARWAVLYVDTPSATGAWFDLQTGVKGTDNTGGATMTDAGGGWFVCSIPQLATGAGSVGVGPVTGNATFSSTAGQTLYVSPHIDIAAQVGSDIVGDAAEVQQVADTVAAGRYYYWLRPFSAANVAGPLTGPKAAVVT